jgi:hypothetical protein
MEANVNERWRDAVRTVHGVESKYKRLVKAIAADIESAALPSGGSSPGPNDRLRLMYQGSRAVF